MRFWCFHDFKQLAGRKYSRLVMTNYLGPIKNGTRILGGFNRHKRVDEARCNYVGGENKVTVR